MNFKLSTKKLLKLKSYNSAKREQQMKKCDVRVNYEIRIFEII